VRVIRRRATQRSSLHSETRMTRETFFFYEKHTGMPQFHVQAGPDGQLPSEHAAALLAMHCLVRGQTPGDYAVMVEVRGNLLGGITEKAEQLLHAGRAVNAGVKLTRREEEVLRGILRSQANKEIASALNLSERTIKFHVSSLLAKFRVRGRMELVREASRVSVSLRPTASAEPTPIPAVNHELRSHSALPACRLAANPGAQVATLLKRQLTA
jgi:DNA-binding CsgD family transcriptional regulator